MEFQDAQMLSDNTPHLTGERALEANLTALWNDFRLHQLLLPTLQDWLDEKGIAFEGFTIDMVVGIAPEDEKNWTFLLLPCAAHSASPASLPQSGEESETSDSDLPPSDSHAASRVIGVTSDGRAGLFSYHRQNVDPCGYIDAIQFEKETAAIQTPADLHAWLETTVSPLIATESLATP
jgi:hypothetical protein